MAGGCGVAEGTTASEPAVVVDTDGPILNVTINRPEKRNATDSEVLCRLHDAWVQLDGDDSLRVAVFSGHGPTFCAGMDLAELARLRRGVADNPWITRVRDDPGIIFRAHLKSDRPTKPIVLAAEGHVRAGGMEMLLGTDIRVAGEGSTFGLTEVQRGLVPMAGSTVRLPRQISHAVAAEMLLTGTDITAARALELGLINHVVTAGHALARAREIAARIAGNGPLAVRAILASLRDGAGRSERDAFAVELRLGNAVMGSKDATEGPRAFLERREPRFTGE
jgi:enoyl-CoA hydratase